MIKRKSTFDWEIRGECRENCCVMCNGIMKKGVFQMEKCNFKEEILCAHYIIAIIQDTIVKPKEAMLVGICITDIVIHLHHM